MFKSEPDESTESLPEAVFAWLDGDTSPEVDAALSAWLRESTGNREVLRDLERIWQLTRTPAASDGWPALEKRLVELENTQPKSKYPVLHVPEASSSFVWRAAAMLVIGLGLGMLWPIARKAFAPVQTVRVVVPAGSQSTVVLPGGVTLQLNYTSELEYSPSANVREVALKGEAYITVPDGKDQNLIVNTEAGVVRDLGTAFSVRAREGMTSVIVTEGSVQLGTEQAQVTLTAGQESSVFVGGAPAAPTPVDVEKALSWMTRRLNFYDQPIGQIAQELEYRYGIRFQVTDPDLRATRITATITPDAGAKEAAEVICMALQARCSRQTDRWTITPR